jgi:L-ascorbate metabolism protein UlaG (beta-lactamase superfamily)
MVKLTYIGHSCVLIANNGSKILVDPFIDGNPFAKLPEKFKPTLILVTHAHKDHLGDTVNLAKDHKCKVLCTFELSNYLCSDGVEAIGANFGGKVPFDFGWVKLWPAMHSSSLPDGRCMGLACSFEISVGGKSIYHAGDTSLTSDMKLVGEDKTIDIACLPIGGLYTMGIDDAVKACKFIKPRVAIPTHYNTFDAISVDASEFEKKLENADVRSKVCILEPGETLELP